jgi:dCTP deaminase
MILKNNEVARRLRRDLTILPEPNLAELRRRGAASIDLRLGRWFLSMRLTQVNVLSIIDPTPKPGSGSPPESTEISNPLREKIASIIGTEFRASSIRSFDVADAVLRESAKLAKPIPQGDEIHKLSKEYFVPFDGSFILHPRSFVLGTTLEWISLPANLTGLVLGKSSWGRRGLVIETAPGIHPGFSGCITLEMTNVGEVPIEIRPGARICQLFLHSTQGNGKIDSSQFSFRRKPALTSIIKDEILLKLGRRS